MPAQLLVQDQDAVITPPPGYLEPLPITRGPSWRPGDVKLVMVTAAATSGGGATQMIQMDPDPPDEFSTAYALSAGNETEGVYWRRRQPDDEDTSVAWRKPPGWRYFNCAQLSVRGTDPAVDPVAGSLVTSITHKTQNAYFTIDPIAVPGPGTMFFFVGAIPDPEGTWPSWATSIGVPEDDGWKHVAATDKSGDKYYAYDVSPSLALFGKDFSGAGTTGTVTVPISPGSHAFSAMWCFLEAAPDGVTVGGAITAVDSVSAGSSATGTDPHSVGEPISVIDSVGTAFNPVHGYVYAKPARLSGRPVAGSVVWCDAWVPPGATATFETSINNGLSWDPAVNGQPVARLLPGDRTTRTVLLRGVFTRESATGPKPRLRKLKLRVGCWKWTDELLPTFYGPVDKAKTKITPGSSGGSGSGGGGQGVTARGGGFFGGGAIVKVHATDPSRLVDAAEWEQPYFGQTGDTYEATGRSMLLNRLPHWRLFNQVSSGHTLDDSLLLWGLSEGGTPWPDIRGVYAAIGHEAFFDVGRAFVTRPVPDPRRGPVVWDFDHTVRPCMIGLESELDTTKIVNGWIIKGESTSSKNPFTVAAINWDTGSRYNAYAPPVGIGKRFKKKTFSLAKTSAQGQDIANGALNNSLGLANTLTVGIIPHPGISTGDISRINSPEAEVVGRFLVQGWTLSDNPVAQQELNLFRQTVNA